MKYSYGYVSVVLALAISVMTTIAWAGEVGKVGEAKETGGSIGCITQHTPSASTGCGGHAPAKTVDEPEVPSPCGMTEVATGQSAKATKRPAMDGRAGGWPRNPGKRLAGTETPPGTDQVKALPYGGCS